MKELVKIQTQLKAPKGQFNSFGKYKYRSLEDITESVKPLLAETGCTLTINDQIELIGDRFYVKATATIANSEGNQISVSAYAREPFEKKGMDSAQVTGATSSYARKYALNGLFAIDDTKDADATNDGTDQKPAKPAKSKMTLEQATDLINGSKTLQALTNNWFKIPSPLQKQLEDLKNMMKAELGKPIALPEHEYNEMQKDNQYK